MARMVDNIVDSAMDPEAILAQNPAHPAPAEILGMLTIIPVTYCGFDGLTHMGQMVVHEAVADDVRDFFVRAFDMQFPIAKVIPVSHQKYGWDDERSCDDNNSSGFNYRTILGTNRLSYHAYGCAFDINPVQNIYVKYDDAGNEIFRAPQFGMYDESVPGTLTEKHPLVIFMKERGWVWGGDWKKAEGRIDYQHFEKHPM